jgi:hypothetical protein
MEELYGWTPEYGTGWGKQNVKQFLYDSAIAETACGSVEVLRKKACHPPSCGRAQDEASRVSSEQRPDHRW